MSTDVESNHLADPTSDRGVGHGGRGFRGMRRGGAMRGGPRGGRGGGRGGGAGRGGFGGSGGGDSLGRGVQSSEIDQAGAQSSSDPEELRQLKSKYGRELGPLKDMFPTWGDEDLLFAIAEANGDVALTAARITEGHATQWGEVKTKKSKKEANTSSNPATNGTVALDGGKLAQGGTVGTYRGKAGSASERGRGGRGRGRAQDNPAHSHFKSTKADESLFASGTPSASNAPMPGSWADDDPSMTQEGSASVSKAAAGETLGDGSGWGESPNEASAIMSDKSVKANGTAEASGWAESTASAITKRADAVSSSKSSRPGLSGGRSWAQIATPAPPKPKASSQIPPAPEAKSTQGAEEQVPKQEATMTESIPATEDSLPSIQPPSIEAGDAEPDFSSGRDLPIAAKFTESEPTIPEQTSETLNQPSSISSNRAPQFARMNSARSRQDAAVVMGKPGHASVGSIGVRFGSLNLGNDAAPPSQETASEVPAQEAETPLQSTGAESTPDILPTESAQPLTSLDQLDSGIQSYGSYNARPHAAAPPAAAEPLPSPPAPVPHSSQGYGGLSGFNQYGAGGSFGQQATGAAYQPQATQASSGRHAQAQAPQSQFGFGQQGADTQRNFYDYSQVGSREQYHHPQSLTESKGDLHHQSHSDLGEQASQHGHGAPPNSQVHQQPTYPGAMNYGYQPYYYMPYQPYGPGSHQSLGAYQYGQLGGRGMYSYGQQKGNSGQSPYGSNPSHGYGAGGVGNLGYPQQQQQQQQPQHHHHQAHQHHQQQHSPDVSYESHGPGAYGQGQQHAPGLSLGGGEYGQGHSGKGGYNPGQAGLPGFLGSSASHQHSFQSHSPSSMTGRPGSTDPSNQSSASMNNQASSATSAASTYRGYGISSPYGDRSGSAMSGAGGVGGGPKQGSGGGAMNLGYGAQQQQQQQQQHQPQHQGYGYYRGGGQQYWGGN